METLANLESFVRSAEHGGFSAAARRLGLTPAAVSRNVAMLERNLGVRLFQRTTRKLALTEAGESFFAAVASKLDGLQLAIAEAASPSAPAGTLRLSVISGFGRSFVLPLLPKFKALYPAIKLDVQLSNRRVDLVADGFDVALGGGFELALGVVAKRVAPSHMVVVASPTYIENKKRPRHPRELATLDGIAMRSVNSGRVLQRVLRHPSGEEVEAVFEPKLILDDQAAIAEAAQLGLGVALVTMPYVAQALKRRELVRLLPDWHVDLGNIALYYVAGPQVPAKTRVFVDYITEAARSAAWDVRFSGNAASTRSSHKETRAT